MLGEWERYTYLYVKSSTKPSTHVRSLNTFTYNSSHSNDNDVHVMSFLIIKNRNKLHRNIVSLTHYSKARDSKKECTDILKQSIMGSNDVLMT